MDDDSSDSTFFPKQDDLTNLISLQNNEVMIWSVDKLLDLNAVFFKGIKLLVPKVDPDFHQTMFLWISLFEPDTIPHDLKSIDTN